MGKGYNNYMCKKPFHPGSKANIKRAWMAEQKTENEKKKQDELKVQYEKEQDLYNNRALISNESKDKLELNFMYEAPPGAKREHQKEDDEPEFKFEWQRKYNAPREDYAKGNADIKDQPFGIPVRNVRCIKCHKWGHINTDKVCPLFSQASTSSMPTTSMDPMELMKQMREDGYNLKENVLGHQLNPKAANQQFIPSDESDPEMEFLKSLSASEKKKLLRKLKKLSNKQAKSSNCKKKKSKKLNKTKSKHDHHSRKKSKQIKESSDDSSKSSSEDSSSNDKINKKSSKEFKRKKESTSSSESDTESEEETRKYKHSRIVRDEIKKNNAKLGQSKKKEYHSETGSKESTKHVSNYSKHEKAMKIKCSTKSDLRGKKAKYCNNETELEKHHTANSDVSKYFSKIKEDRITSTQFLSKEKHQGSDSSSSESEDERNLKSTKMHSPNQSSNIYKKTNKNNYNSLRNQDGKETKTNKIGDDDKSENGSKSIKYSDKCNEPKYNIDDSKNREGSTLDTSNSKCNSLAHPDGFSHLCPQARIEANYLQVNYEYQGNVHDKFRYLYRERRSPSVKQKYNK